MFSEFSTPTVALTFWRLSECPRPKPYSERGEQGESQRGHVIDCTPNRSLNSSVTAQSQKYRGIDSRSNKQWLYKLCNLLISAKGRSNSVNFRTFMFSLLISGKCIFVRFVLDLQVYFTILQLWDYIFFWSFEYGVSCTFIWRYLLLLMHSRLNCHKQVLYFMN